MTLLVLALTAPVTGGGFGWSAAAALGLYGGLVAAVQALPVAGGALSDSLLGPARALRIGAILMLLGHMTLAVPHMVPIMWERIDPEFDRSRFLATQIDLQFCDGSLPERLIVGSLYAGLALVALGNALFKPNISAIIGRLGFGSHAARDAGFSLFHMFVNLGGLIAILLGGWVAERFGYGPAFTLAGFGMVAALGLMHVFRAIIASPVDGIAHPAQTAPATNREAPLPAKWILPVSVVLVAVTLFGVTLFQVLGTLNLYAASRVEASLWGVDFPPVWILSANPIVMLLVMPPLAKRWREGRGPGAKAAISGKAAVGFAFLALAFGSLAAAEFLAREAVVPTLVLAAAIALITIAELLVGPSALSAITRIIPANRGALGAGMFYAALGLGGFLSGQIGASAQDVGFLAIFNVIAGCCGAIAAGLFLSRRAAARIGL
ncbi:hypothetical protein [Sphingosinicella microcystinivorans]|nr:hypothetical protein [Sphingosinicella microcystinivorans]